jgi:hypothetical protein
MSGPHDRFTLEDARELARAAHAGQVDKLGVEYLQHVEAVAAGLADFDEALQIAGMLHDVVEDCGVTVEDLRTQGVPERALAAITLVSRNLHPDLTYDQRSSWLPPPRMPHLSRSRITPTTRALIAWPP